MFNDLNYQELKILILIDEYDLVLNNESFSKKRNVQLKLYKTFFSTIKTYLENNSFCFITGITPLVLNELGSGLFTWIMIFIKCMVLQKKIF